ncbi:2-amino-4-hydroxy-6-hydroxymethyldihydropteridine diphosphokinase [Arenibacter sp. BSSL-BM3]|uniref:2-amino-4-hydroxy-6-hydroxymethyldihydropteridine pyrophosphokinase n=1 Tax=Arenibacter arenosicollis TaxID=2762274 RepID=A0ABR7QJ05_9FLAO|nr:2-amino-4-hydroxy-6-hydroxymethyldihydropteridine diphosphokinase [Arenibacter arenosicollis]MBC8767163.1 2-amino-4-hydroxy-6-hydroxymethyldihydropteridine diphosphokinase [Arenibacter arenosicollis]
MNKTATTYLSLGSNLGDKLNHLQEVVFLIHSTIGNVVKISPIYETPAWGFEGEDFYNCCIAVETSLMPLDLLKKLLEIETRLGRERNEGAGYASRTVDIDIIYYEREIINSAALTIPHPSLQLRRFVLRPLADIAPQFYHPVLNKDTRNLLQECKDKSNITRTHHKLYTTRSQLFSQLQYIAIEGNIGAGKTTLAHKIGQDFNAKLVLERFADNPFLPKFYEDQSRFAFPLEMSFLADRYQQFMDDTSQYDLFKNFMVSDYDINKSLIFAKVTLQEEEFKLYRKLFNLMHKEIKKPTMYIYLYQNTERLLQNIKQRGRDYEQNIAPEYLEKLNRGYFDFLKSFPEQNNLIVDVSELDFVENLDDYEVILDQIQKFAVKLSF